MNPFEYRNPVRVIFGAGTFSRSGEEIAKIGKKALVVSYGDKSVETTLEKLGELLSKAGVEAETFLEVTPNPPIEMVARGVAKAKEFGADVIVGVGGGSAMDAAKAVAAGVCYEGGDLWNMVYASHSNVTAKPPEKALPIFLVPTLPATGSEMNMCSVVSSSTLNKKSYIWADCLFPKASILDPELTYTLPPFQTACGGIDSISTMKPYISPESIAATVMKVIRTAAPRLLRRPSNQTTAGFRI